MLKRLVSVCVVLLVAGCGKDGSPTGPTNSNPPPPSNGSPVIGAVQVAPTFGIADLTVFNFSATATDPNSDPLTYSWSIAGGTFPGSSGQLLFPSPGGNGRATVTVTDGKGGSATGSVNFIVGSMQGTWTIVGGELDGGSFVLTQNPAGIVLGTYNDPIYGTGSIDPAEPGSITAAAFLTMRVKIDRFTDFTMTGTMDTTGLMITGNIRGSGFTGQPFVMVKTG